MVWVYIYVIGLFITKTDVERKLYDVRLLGKIMSACVLANQDDFFLYSVYYIQENKIFT